MTEAIVRLPGRAAAHAICRIRAGVSPVLPPAGDQCLAALPETGLERAGEVAKPVPGRTEDPRPRDRAFVRLIAELSHELGIQTIAEFVEQEAVLDQVRDLGIDYAQGFLLGRPLPQPGPPLAVDRD
jgi:hypothetical protein